MTGELIRASKATAVRYEQARPGELADMDVKKIDKIPDGGGWRAACTPWSMTDNHWSYTKSEDVREAMKTPGAKHKLIRAHCPWQNGKGGALQPHPAEGALHSDRAARIGWVD